MKCPDIKGKNSREYNELAHLLVVLVTASVVDGHHVMRSHSACRYTQEGGREGGREGGSV